MAQRKSRTNRFDNKVWQAIDRVAKARNMSRAKLLEMCFLRYQQDVKKLSDAERDKLEAEALAFLESIEQGSKE